MVRRFSSSWLALLAVLLVVGGSIGVEWMPLAGRGISLASEAGGEGHDSDPDPDKDHCLFCVVAKSMATVERVAVPVAVVRLTAPIATPFEPIEVAQTTFLRPEVRAPPLARSRI